MQVDSSPASPRPQPPRLDPDQEVRHPGRDEEVGEELARAAYRELRVEVAPATAVAEVRVDGDLGEARIAPRSAKPMPTKDDDAKVKERRGVAAPVRAYDAPAHASVLIRSQDQLGFAPRSQQLGIGERPGVLAHLGLTRPRVLVDGGEELGKPHSNCAAISART